MNKLYLSALTLALGLGVAPAEITVLNPASATPSENSATLTWSQTIASGADRLLVVGFGYENSFSGPVSPISISSVTYNGTTLNSAIVADSVSPAAGSNVSALYYLVNPTVGTFNVVVTLSGAPGNAASIFGGSLQANGINQTIPVGTAVSGFGLATTCVTSNYTLASGVDYLVVDFVDVNLTGHALTGSPSQTGLNFVTGVQNNADMGYRLATGTGIATSSTWTAPVTMARRFSSGSRAKHGRRASRCGCRTVPAAQSPGGLIFSGADLSSCGSA